MESPHGKNAKFHVENQKMAVVIMVGKEGVRP